jgi:hypothetical protein
MVLQTINWPHLTKQIRHTSLIIIEVSVKVMEHNKNVCIVTTGHGQEATTVS